MSGGRIRCAGREAAGLVAGRFAAVGRRVSLAAGSMALEGCDAGRLAVGRVAVALGSRETGRLATGRAVGVAAGVGLVATGRVATGRDGAGRETAGRLAGAGRETAGREAAGREAAGRDAVGRDAAGREAELGDLPEPRLAAVDLLRLGGHELPPKETGPSKALQKSLLQREIGAWYTSSHQTLGPRTPGSWNYSRKPNLCKSCRREGREKRRQTGGAPHTPPPLHALGLDQCDPPGESRVESDTGALVILSNVVQWSEAMGRTGVDSVGRHRPKYSSGRSS